MLKEIKDKIDTYKGSSVDLGYGLSFNQWETLRRIFFYRNSKHLSGDIDPLTKKVKPFPNISRFRARVVAKMLDFDVKDLRVITDSVYDLLAQLKAYLLEKKIKNWAKENGFGFLLNQIVVNVSDYGSALVMKLPGKIPEIIDLKSVYFDPSVDKIQDAPSIVLEREFFVYELENKNWDNIKLLINELENEKKDKITVYYYFGYFKKGKKYQKGVKIYSDALKNYKEGIKLFEEWFDEDYPFYDFHINKIQGRWLGVGTYEELFHPQIRELINAGLRARALELASKQVLQTPNETALKNIVSDVETGDVILGDIRPIPLESRALTQFQQETEYWNALADRSTFTYDVVRGEGLPATTPATNATIQTQMATSTFDLLRENLAFQIINFIKKAVLPDVLKELRGEMVVRFTSSFEDINKFDEMIAKIKANEYAVKYLEATGFYPSNIQEVENKIKDELKSAGLIRGVKIPRGFFADLKDVDIIIDSESRNVPLEAQNLNALLQMIVSNPQALSNPTVKSLIYAYAEKIGISPIELERIQRSELTQTPNVNPGQPQTSVPQPQEQQGLGISSAIINKLSQ